MDKFSDMEEQEELEDYARKKSGLKREVGSDGGRPKPNFRPAGTIRRLQKGLAGSIFTDEFKYPVGGEVIPPEFVKMYLNEGIFPSPVDMLKDGEEIYMAHPSRESANRRVVEEMYQLRNRLIQLTREHPNGCAGCGRELDKSGSCESCMAESHKDHILEVFKEKEKEHQAEVAKLCETIEVLSRRRPKIDAKWHDLIQFAFNGDARCASLEETLIFYLRNEIQTLRNKIEGLQAQLGKKDDPLVDLTQQPE